MRKGKIIAIPYLMEKTVELLIKMENISKITGSSA
jgi:hypothetical protein